MRKSVQRALLVAVCAFVPILAVGQLAPELQRGLDWLSARVQAGQVEGETASAANPTQVRSEAIQTLRRLAALPAPLADSVFAGDAGDADTETLSRRIVAGAATSQDLQPLLSVLAERQNDDGGYGGGPGYSSAALDTAWALLAQAQAGQGSTPVAVQARSWLAGRVNTTGPLAGALQDNPGSRPAPALVRLYTTALASLALQTGSDAPSTQTVPLITGWLASQQGTDGGWAGDTLVSAWVLLAVAPVSNDTGLKNAASTFLQSRQAADGSWNGDPYITAVALRALTARPSPVGNGSLSGQVFDASTGLPLEGASIAITAAAQPGDAPLSAASDVLGNFSLGGVAAGNWNVVISRPGYQSQLAAIALAGGQSANLGLVRLQPNSSTGIVRGTVTAQAGGQALPGVVVTATVAGMTHRATTDANGRYELSAVTPGTVSLSTSLSGYQASSASATLVAGQTLVFSPALVRTGSTATGPGIFAGRVVNAADQAPLPGARIDITHTTSGSTSAVTTAANGQFSASLAAGSYTARYSASGFNAAQQSLLITVAGNLNVGTVALSPQATDAQLRGRVLGDDGQSVAGAKVALFGPARPAQSALTATDGSYTLNAIALGAAQLRVTAMGYLSREASVDFGSAGSYVQDFTLQRVAAAGIDIRITSFTADTPTVAAAGLAGFAASITNTGTAAQTVRLELELLDEAGQYAGAGSALGDSGQGQSDFLIPQAASLPVRLQWNVGGTTPAAYQARLRVFDVATLTLLAEADVPIAVTPGVQRPDLLITRLERGTAISDAQSLRVDGQLAAQLHNRGDAALSDTLTLKAFIDLNRNGRYDDTDTVLGQWRGPLALPAGASTAVAVPVRGTLPFRDAPMLVWADSQQEVAESNENNNVASTASSAQILPQASAFVPQLKWHWTGAGSQYPNHKNVLMAPTVGRLLDTNGDGSVNAADDVLVVFTSFTSDSANAGIEDGVIRVVRGSNGAELLAIKDAAFPISNMGGLALADLDKDGRPEIVALTRDNRVIVFRGDGSRWWVTPVVVAAAAWGSGGTPTVADLDGDGWPEVVYEKSVFSHTGLLKWRGTGSYSGTALNFVPHYSIPVVADLFNTGTQNVILGASVYSAAGALIWQASEGSTAVADFDRDGTPDLAIQNNGVLSLRSASGSLRWQVAIPGGGYGGPPTVADVDGDGTPDIGVAGATRYTVFRGDGTVIWSKVTQDGSSQVTGSTVFDFDGDGKAEVLYADEVMARAYSGASGALLWQLPNSSATGLEYPVVADVDGDGHADMLVAANSYRAIPNATLMIAGLRAFQDQNNAWVNVRPVWNQHAYSITNINDDLTVPAQPVPSWVAHNTFRLNSTLGLSPTAVPDITAGYLRLSLGTDGRVGVRARVGNGGGRSLGAGAKVALYSVGASGTNTRLAVATLAAGLASGDFVEVDFAPLFLDGAARLAVVADDDGTGITATDDFERSNNRVELDLAGYPLGLGLSAATDRPSYGADLPVLVSVPVTNRGGAAIADSQVAIEIQAPGGQVLASLGTYATGPIAAGATLQVNAVWNTGASTAAAGYRAVATLLDAQGRTVNSAQASFTITSLLENGVSARIAADRALYGPNDTVLLSERISNLQSNTALEGLTARTIVRNASGGLVWQRNEPLAQLSAGLYKDLNYAIVLANAVPGRYTISLDVLDTAQALLASDSGHFDVGSGSASGLGGSLQATPRSVAVGQATVLQWSVVNQGSGAYTGLPMAVRIIDPLAPDAGTAVVAELPTPVDLAVGQSFNTAQNWTPGAAQAGKTYVAALVAQLPGGAVTLAQDRVQVGSSPPVASIHLDVQRRAETRLLVLVSCPPGPGGQGWGLQSAPTEAACAQARADALRTLLTPLVPVLKVVTTAAEYETELRCGHYNAHWLSGGSTKLAEGVVVELREAVRRGDGLLLDGPPGPFDPLLHTAAGVRRLGAYPYAGLSIELMSSGMFGPGSPVPGGLFGAGSLPLPLRGPAQSVQAAGAQVHARLGGVVMPTPTLLSREFGQGRVLVAAFDLASLFESNGNDALEQHVLVQSLAYLANAAADPVSVGAPVALGYTLRNDGSQAQHTRLQVQLPAGARFFSATPGAVPDAQGVVAWEQTLEPGSTQLLVLRVGLGAAGLSQFQATVLAGLPGQALQSQGTQTTTVLAESAATLADQALQAVTALVPATPEETTARAYALKAAVQAVEEGLGGDHFGARLSWLQAARELDPIAPATSAQAAAAVARALQATTRALCPELACVAGEVDVLRAGQPVLQVPRNTSAQFRRKTTNACPVPAGTWDIHAELSNRNSGQSLADMKEQLDLVPGYADENQADFKAVGQAGDPLDGLLLAKRQGVQVALARARFTIVPLSCDVNIDGVVDIADLTLIQKAMLAREVPYPGDPRDPNNDGVINSGDGRLCALQCTQPGCGR